jgi:signal transduction histidine kinase
VRRSRLHLQIFRALVATGVSCFLVTGLIGRLLRNDEQQWPRLAQDIGAFIVAGLPDRDEAALREELSRRGAQLHASISLWNEQGELLAHAGERLGPERIDPDEGEALVAKDGAVRVRLRDGRTLALAFEHQPASFVPMHFVFMLGLLLATLLLGSWLAARRISRRLERLERGVTRFGAGDLDARVSVGGRDEIASLARAFNRSFDRIASLLKQQRRMLQSASHELRSPLARVRMALELATEPDATVEARELLRRDATRDIEELDLLISDLLLAGRLADTELPREFTEIPLHALVGEEAERVRARGEGGELYLEGNPRMLRSLVRNLLENARRHGRDPIHASWRAEGREIVLCGEDAGDGVPERERERIFEAFYRPPGHREGTDGGVGLGLALVKTIAEHHGGSARYRATPTGSCFEVRLPASR